MKILSIVVTIILTAITLGCENNTGHQYQSEQSKDSNMKVSTELGILTKLMPLPYNPSIIAWGIDEKRTPARDVAGTLYVLLKYSEEEYNKVVKNSTPYDNPNVLMYIRSNFYTQWIPETLKAKLNVKELSDRFQVLDVQSAEPNLFIDTDLSPYVNGRLTFLDNEHVFIMLHSS